LDSGALANFPAYLVVIRKFNTNNTTQLIRFNGDAGANYDYRTTRNFAGITASGATEILINSVGDTSQVFWHMWIDNHSATERKKVRGIGQTLGATITDQAGIWNNVVDLITSIQVIQTVANNWTADDSIAVYGFRET